MKEIAAVTLKIALCDIRPEVQRRVVVPFGIRLSRLHTVIQTAMGWTDTHLWEFQAAGCSFGLPDPDGFKDLTDAGKTTLLGVVRDTGVKTLHYIYDFGDYWDHAIKIKRTRQAPAQLDFPFLLDATGACPPEDCGGAPGYEEFLTDPEQRGDFDPAHVDSRMIAQVLGDLAKSWRPKTRTAKRSGAKR